MPAVLRTIFEPRFGRDFSPVRFHTGTWAETASRSVGALAYTLDADVVFGAGRYQPHTDEGRRLIAHELVHVVQQQSARATSGLPAATRSDSAVLQRACLSAGACAVVAGSASTFGTAVESAETRARARRAAMTPARQRATGHTGPARQLESFLNGQTPGLLANIHGIFIDQDMDPSVAASTQPCASMVPPILGATKPCVFVPGRLNQEALTFNTNPAAATIGGRSREDWRISTLQTLTHEIQHVVYDVAMTGAARPSGVTCLRTDVEFELSELNAIMSEFPSVFDAVPTGAPAGDPARVRLDAWFTHSITNVGESIRGTLKAVDCKCSCADTDAYVKETFAFVSSSWTAAQKAAFNTELRRPVWGLRWPP